jgi:hypothetical protein
VSRRDYLNRVSSIGCILCKHLGLGETPAEIHHVESVRDELSDFAVVPLCTEHHRGQTGVHGLRRRGFETRYKLSDVDLLAMTARELA